MFEHLYDLLIHNAYLKGVNSILASPKPDKISMHPRPVSHRPFFIEEYKLMVHCRFKI